MIGETLGSYEIVEQIGVGGMGAVFLGRHKLIGRKVAIKVLLAEYSNREEAVNRFFNEAKATASLRHPSLVDVFDFGYAKDGSAYLVMEYLEGENLGARLRRLGKLPVPQALEFARQIAMGVGVAHAAGIVHRDLKPDNVFLVPSPMDPALEMVKLLDFGIAKITGKMAGSMAGGLQKTQTGMMLGTPLYMAPEQCRGAGYVDARSDTYAFGCIVFAMLTGRPPFVHEYPGELIAAHLHEAPPRVKSLREEVPASLDDLVDKLLAKQPEARPESMAAVTKALGKIAAEVGIARTSMLGGSYAIHKGQQRTTAALPTADDKPLANDDAATGAGSKPMEASLEAAAGATRLMAPASDQAPLAPSAAVEGTKLLSRESAAHAVAHPPAKAPGSTTLSAGAGEVTHAPRADADSPAPKRTRTVALGVVAAVGLATAGFFLLQGHDDATAPRPAAKVELPVREAPEEPPPAPPPADPPAPQAAPVVAPEPAPEPAGEAPAADEQASFVVVRVKNGRPGLTAYVDDQKSRLPIKLPKDGKTYTIRFEVPNFHPESFTIKPTRNRVITLQYKPFLFIE